MRRLLWFIPVWLAAVALIAHGATLPDGYAIANNIAVQPWSEAFWFSLVALGECGVLVLLLRPWSFGESWGRLLTVALVFAVWFLLGIPLLMHGSPVYGAHALWLLVVVVGLVVYALILLVARWLANCS